MFTVFDIDGVVADVTHRLHHLAPSQRDWHQFHARAVDDTVLPDGRALAEQAAATGDVVWLTGRPAWARELTVAWLADSALPPGELLMRRDDDHRPARVVKLAAIRRLAADRPRELVRVVDDDPEVIDSLAAAGFPTLLATWLPRRDPRHDLLADAQERFGQG